VCPDDPFPVDVEVEHVVAETGADQETPRFRRDDPLAPLRPDVPQRPPADVLAAVLIEGDDRGMVPDRQRHRAVEAGPTALAGEPALDRVRMVAVVAVCLLR